MNTLYQKFIDKDLQDILERRVKTSSTRPIVVGTGITSSHLGDERNLREFVLADAIVACLRSYGKNVIFLLFDDSYDPLNFRQLRVAVDKDEQLIKKFEKYCGTPIKLIPDPFNCHDSYADHFQSKILERFHHLDIYPNMIDSHSSYHSGLYDFAKEIVFTRMEEIKDFLKKKFPNYHMKKIFWPLCPTCSKLDESEIDNIEGKKISISCKRCMTQHITTTEKIKGKFSWKVDIAVKWNIFKSDFEPFSKAYLDPDVGSYFIAKSLSEEFFGGHYPEIIEYGQVFMDRELSYALLPSLPREIFDLLFLDHRKKDMKLSKQKIIQVAKQYEVRKDMTYFDYIQILLPYENLEYLSSDISPFERNPITNYGNKFTK
ncbi:MAG: hypothetical protein Q8P72_04475, partial [Candidatus Roizmanbacteria bacterium]|nr:hypothetical protein [Candidatus Roizmanbacteria bacterium]